MQFLFLKFQQMLQMLGCLCHSGPSMWTKTNNVRPSIVKTRSAIFSPFNSIKRTPLCIFVTCVFRVVVCLLLFRCASPLCLYLLVLNSYITVNMWFVKKNSNLSAVVVVTGQSGLPGWEFLRLSFPC